MIETHRATSGRSLVDVLLEKAEVGLCLVASDGTILRGNAEWLRATGLTPPHEGKNVVDLLPVSRDEALAMLARARAGERVEIPRHGRSVHGRTSWWEGSVEPVPVDGATGLLVTVRRARSDFRVFYETAPAAFLVLAPDRPRFTIVAASEAYMRATKTSPDIIGRGIFEVFPDDPSDPASTGSPARASFERVLDTGAPDAMAVQKHSIRRPEAEGGGFEERYWSPVNTPVLGEDEVLYIHHRVEDVTEFVRQKQKGAEQEAVAETLRTRAGEMEADVLRRAQEIQEVNRQLREANRRLAELDREKERRAEEALRESEAGARRRAAELQAVLDAVPAAVFITRDPDAAHMEANRFCAEMLRMPVGSNVSKSAPEREAPRDFRAMKGGVEIPPEQLPVQLAAATGREVRSYEFDLVFADGNVRHLFGNAAPLTDPDGTTRGAVAAFVDITERKRAEEALRYSEAKYRSLFTSIDEGFCIVEVLFEGEKPTDYRFLDANPAFERHTGLKDAIGRRMRELVPAHEEHWFRIYGDVARTGEAVRFENPADALGRYYDVYAFRVGPPSERRVAVLFYDVSARKRAEERLREANARLVEADRRKDDFLGMLSHELRNPLAPIRNSLYILDHAEATGQQAQRAKAVASRQLAHLTRLVDDLLDVTRISRGKVELRRTVVDLCDLVRRTGEDYRALMHERGLEFAIEAPRPPIRVDGDETRLAQIVGNLLQNAAKFTQTGGSVALAIAQAGDSVEIHVRDTGAGIAPDLLSRVFEPFMQAKQSIARTEGGLGLGLALVKGLVELHGGTVAAASEGPGRGTEFTVRLPLARAAQHAPR